MLRPQLQSFIKVSLPTPHGLVRESRDQVEVNILKAGFAEMIERGVNIARRMRTPELFQLAIVECLRPKAGSFDPAATKLKKLFLFRHRTYAAISRIQVDCH